MPPPAKADLWSAGVDEAVEVNQRALIDSEWSVMYHGWQTHHRNPRTLLRREHKYERTPVNQGDADIQSSENSFKTPMTPE